MRSSISLTSKSYESMIALRRVFSAFGSSRSGCALDAPRSRGARVYPIMTLCSAECILSLHLGSLRFAHSTEGSEDGDYAHLYEIKFLIEFPKLDRELAPDSPALRLCDAKPQQR